MSDPAIALMVVQGGCGYPYAPRHVELQVIDIDNIKESGRRAILPSGIGFEQLVQEAGISEYVCFRKPRKRK